jgi:hypothetical protein
LPGPSWLYGLLKTAQNAPERIWWAGHKAPVFADQNARSLAAIIRFSPRITHADRTAVPILYSSGNVLISRPVLDMMPHPFLDPAFNFHRRRRQRLLPACQGRVVSAFAWCAEAVQ